MKLYQKSENIYLSIGSYVVNLTMGVVYNIRYNPNTIRVIKDSKKVSKGIFYGNIIDDKICIDNHIIDLKNKTIVKSELPKRKITLKVDKDKENRLRFYKGKGRELLITESNNIDRADICRNLIGVCLYKGLGKNWIKNYFQEVDSISFKAVIIKDKIYIKGDNTHDSCVIDLRNNTIKKGELPKRKIILNIEDRS